MLNFYLKEQLLLALTENNIKKLLAKHVLNRKAKTKFCGKTLQTKKTANFQTENFIACTILLMRSAKDSINNMTYIHPCLKLIWKPY